MIRNRGVKIFVMSFLAFFCNCWASGDVTLGVYYFPGWKIGAEKVRYFPWDAIKKYPEREPLVGWYDEGDVKYAAQQIGWMRDYGIDYVVYDWYWERGSKNKYLSHALDNYLAINQVDVKFSILWANTKKSPKNLDELNEIVDSWILLAEDPRFFKINKSPVVYILSPQKLDESLVEIGLSGAYFIDIANKKIRDKFGFNFYFVGCANAISTHVEKIYNQGYNAISSYNYHRGYSGRYEPGGLSVNYNELIAGYAESWNWFFKNSSIDYIVPVTSGWDKRPWKDEKYFDPHDGSASDPVSFRRHLYDAFSAAIDNRKKTNGLVIVCCWNEFGEGSYIEPTKKYGFEYMSVIKSVKKEFQEKK